jgi:hypothetical protein
MKRWQKQTQTTRGSKEEEKRRKKRTTINSGGTKQKIEGLALAPPPFSVDTTQYGKHFPPSSQAKIDDQ